MRVADALLLARIFGSAEVPLARSCASYLSSAPRFRVFLEQYEGKIRKKVRAMRDDAASRDLLAELVAAARLLADRRFTVEYEKYAAEKRRGPDLTATYRLNTLCNIEIKRLRAVLTAQRIGDVICAKLRQLPPGMINVLLIAAEPAPGSAPPLAEAMTLLRQRAEARDDDYFQRRGPPDARDFSRRLPLLSGVLCHAGWDAAGGGALTLWPNPQARHPLPPDVARALLAPHLSTL